MAKTIIEAINTSFSFQFDGDTAELRLYPTQAFVTFDGQLYGQGQPFNEQSWYLPIPCEIQPTGILYVPSFEIDSTTDGQPRTAKYIAALFSEDGAYIGPMPSTNPSGFAIPPPEIMPAPTWGQLAIYNRLPTLLYPPVTFAPREEMYAAIAAAIGEQQNASSTNKGVTALDVDPDDPTFPIAVGVNSPLIVSNDASATVKGITELTVDPVVATIPIAVGANDPFWLEIIAGGSGLGQLRIASRTCALDSNVITGGGTDDTAALQALLDVAIGGDPLYLIIDGAALTGGLNVYGNTTIYCINSSCGFYLADGTDRALLRNATPSTSTITDKNIALVGGTYNGNSVNQTGIGSFNTQEVDGTLIGLIQMYGVQTFRAQGLDLLHSKTIALHLSNVNEFNIDDIFFDNFVVGQFQQGGLQIEGLCFNGTISNLRGTTEDDFLAFSSDGASYVNPPFIGLGPYVVAGEIDDISVTNMVGQTGTSCFRLFNTVSRIDRIRVSNVTGTWTRLFTNDPATADITGNVGTIVLDGVNITPAAGFQALIEVHQKIDHLVLRDIQINDPSQSRPIVRFEQGSNLKIVDIDGLSIYSTDFGSYDLTPIIVEGRIGRLRGRNWRWAQNITLPAPSTTTPFLTIQTNNGSVNDLSIDGAALNLYPYLAYQKGGFIRTARLSSIYIEDSDGGAALRVDGNDLVDVSVNSWYGEMAPPFFSTSSTPRKRGDCFPADTVAPTFSAAICKGSADIVIVTFSEAVNAINFALGVTIKKNTVAQTISGARFSAQSQAIVIYQLSAAITLGDTVTWEYAAASGFITDWSSNPLANVAAQAVTNANTTRVFERFLGTPAEALNGRTPLPTTTGGNNWITLRGTAGLQTLAENATMAQLASPFGVLIPVDALNDTVQSLVVNSTFADVIISVEVTMTEVIGSAGIVFRATDALNFWLFWITPTHTELWKVTAGVVAGVSNLNFHGLEIPYRLEVTLAGNNISCTVNGGEVIATADAFNAAATSHGIQGSQGNNYFDDFMVVS